MRAAAKALDGPVPDWPVIWFLIAVHVVALSAFVPATFSWAAVGVALFLHWLTGGVGITLGYHRLITHRSFQTPKWIEYILLFCGTLACQAPLEWVAKHRMHHQHTDTDQDPHNINRGFWWAHAGWLMCRLPCDRQIAQFTKDIGRNRVYRFFDRSMLVWQVALGVALYLLGGWSFVVWGIFVRLVLVYHCTWFVNSATHRFGYQSHPTRDQSTNCWWVALLTYGEGWHNNHHAYPRSARQGLRWWEIDMTWWMVRVLEFLGLARRIKLPPATGPAAATRLDAV